MERPRVIRWCGGDCRKDFAEFHSADQPTMRVLIDMSTISSVVQTWGATELMTELGSVVRVFESYDHVVDALLRLSRGNEMYDLGDPSSERIGWLDELNRDEE